MAFSSLLARIYAPEHLLKKSEIQGELPTSKETYSELVRMAWPATLESVLVSLLKSLDSIMLASLGAFAIAAVGLTTQPQLLLMAVITSINVGVMAVIARRRGEGNRDAANRTLCQGVLLSLSVAVFLAVVGFIFTRPLLLFVGAQADTINPAMEYFRYMLVGFPFYAVSTTLNAAQRGTGNTKVTLRTNVVASAVKVALNFMLINGFLFFPALGIKGAGLAYLANNLTMFVISVESVLGYRGYLHLDIKHLFSLDTGIMKGILTVGSGSAVEQVCLRTGMILFSRTIAQLGTIEFATHQICSNLMNFSNAIGDGVSVSATSLVGQNLGKKRPDISLLYGRAAQRINLATSAFSILLFSLLGRQLMRIFTRDAQIINAGVILLLILAVMLPFQTSNSVLTGSLRGAGDVRFTAAMVLLSTTILRPLDAWLFVNVFHLGVAGAWMAMAIDHMLRFGAIMWRFNSCRWMKIKL